MADRRVAARWIAAFLAGVTVATGAGRSEETWLPGAEILQAFNGVTLNGRYADGRTFTESYRSDGSLAYSDQRMTSGGHWSVTAGTFCTIYDTDSAGGCFRVARVGANCFEFYFVTRTEEAAPGPAGTKPAWTARGAISGKPGSCNPDASA